MTNREIKVLKNCFFRLCAHTRLPVTIFNDMMSDLDSLKQPEQKLTVGQLAAIFHPFPPPEEELRKHGHLSEQLELDLNPGGTD